MVKKSIEEISQGDILYINFDPTKGHEQQGFRPCIVLTKRIPFLKNMFGVAPITSKSKEFPLHINLPTQLKTHGQVLLEQHRMIDICARGFKYIETVDSDFVRTCTHRLNLMYNGDN